MKPAHESTCRAECQKGREARAEQGRYQGRLGDVSI